MTIEQSLAARQISRMLREGWPKAAVIAATAKMVKGQGFGAAHAQKTAEEMFDLVA